MTYRVRLVCTGRDSHRRRVLAAATLLGDGWVMVRPASIRCPTCGRNPVLRPERWQAAMPRLRAAGVSELDISRHIPF